MQKDTKITSKQTLVLLVACLLLCVFSIQLIRVARLYSANWDEAHHLYDGYLILTQGDYRTNAEVPPLVKLTAALPLLRLHPALPPPTGTSQAENAFLAGRLFVFGNGGDRLLFPARVACMFFALITAVLVFAAGRLFFGFSAGLCALLLFVFDPNVLAHGTLISTDVGSACFFLASAYAFYRYTIQLSWWWLLATGLFTGLALVTKFTGILLVPMLLLLAVAEGIRERKPATAAKLLGAALAALACGWLLVWTFYGFRYAPAPHGLQLSPALDSYLASLPNPADGRKLALLARFHLLPEAYLWGLANTRHTEWQYTSYFLGHVYRHGPWLYFPVAFLIKSTLPLLLLLALTPFVWLRAGRPFSRQIVFLLVPVGVYLAVVATSHFDIGARHLMPVYPFLYILAGGTAAMALRKGPGWAMLAGSLLIWQAVTTLRVAPDYMAYGNEAFGGPLHVRQYLSDANVDWGQQLKTVKAYLDDNHISNCWFAYFPDGAVQPGDYGVHCRRLPTPSALWWFDLPMDVPAQISGTVLISESDLDGVESGEGSINPYDAFRHLTPAAILQDGVYVYQGTFPVALASAWVDLHHSAKLVQAGDLDGALVLAQRAAAVAPSSTRTQVQLAEVLAQKQQWASAGEHYRLAQQLLQRERPDLQGEELGPQIEHGLQAVASRQP